MSVHSAPLLSSLRHYRDRRIAAIFCFGMASGFPWVMIGSALTAWLKDGGLSRGSIGLFGIIFAAYSINFLWSPLLDRVRLPLLSRKLGQRRSWIALTQWGVAGCCMAMATFQLELQLFYIALFGLLIAICSATQDIAVDAFRIDVIGHDEKDKLSAASAMATAGWWTGYGGLGAIPFFLADSPHWAWHEVYFVLAAIMLLLHVTVYFVEEPKTDRAAQQAEAMAFYQQKLLQRRSHSWLSKATAWLLVTIVEPFKEFFNRNGVKFALSVLLFIFLFKIGEAFLGRMSIVFYKELGFSNSDIGSLSKLLNWWVTIVFAVIGGLVNIRYGIYRGLMIAGIAMAASNLMFSAMAHVGPSKPLFVATIIIDGFTAAWSSVALVAFISLLCNKAFSASQYALMASLGVLGRTVLASGSGFIVDGLDGNWSVFFALTAVMVIPSLLFLYRIRHKIHALEQRSEH
ncbi:AmpG family muropeptide MFS transporter [Alteromonas oceanisediminis]|uniref:AmpG family muropeptide MFS transporter n=1 Tax=Alteromonas oceanisediminis TaxID=2836180 RepID=UPI0028F3F607|nr:MFS transporter [Alteromonas oceanisediminis]